MPDLRIVSLLPAATEMVFELGLEKNLVGVSDDSDFPPAVRKLPKIVTTTLPQDLTSRQIDNRVRTAKHRGISIFHVDQKLLRKLRPNLILSQELCEVCAVSASEIRRAARILKNPVRTVSLEPDSISDILENIRTIGEMTGTKNRAKQLVGKLSKRLNKIRRKIIAAPTAVKASALQPVSFAQRSVRPLIPRPSTIEGEGSRKRILIVEWLDPIMVAGHWVPEMVELAGGENLISKKGEISKRITWEEAYSADPDILIIAPCGFDIVRTKQETSLVKNRKGFNKLKAARNGRAYLVDGNAYLTRPGLRIVDGIEILAEIIHPELFERKYSLTDWQKLTSY